MKARMCTIPYGRGSCKRIERLIKTLISQRKEQVGRTKAKLCSQMESVMNHRDHIRKYSVNISEVKEKALNTLVAFGCILRPKLVKQKTIVCLLTEVNPTHEWSFEN